MTLHSWLLAVLLATLGIVILVAWARSRRSVESNLLTSDTERTMNAVRDSPEAVQSVIARNVFNEIVQSLREIERTPGPSSSARDKVIRHQLGRAQASRHQALRRGAKDWADPDWATAAIVEGWLMANSGALDQTAFHEIDMLVITWLREILNETDFEELEK